MNIFELYLKKIKQIVITLNSDGILELPNNLDSINVDLPPTSFDADISTNVAVIQNFLHFIELCKPMKLL